MAWSSFLSSDRNSEPASSILAQKALPMATDFTSLVSEPQPPPSMRIGVAKLNWSKLRSTPRGSTVETGAVLERTVLDRWAATPGVTAGLTAARPGCTAAKPGRATEMAGRAGIAARLTVAGATAAEMAAAGVASSRTAIDMAGVDGALVTAAPGADPKGATVSSRETIGAASSRVTAGAATVFRPSDGRDPRTGAAERVGRAETGARLTGAGAAVGVTAAVIATAGRAFWGADTPFAGVDGTAAAAVTGSPRDTTGMLMPAFASKPMADKRVEAIPAPTPSRARRPVATKFGIETPDISNPKFTPP
mmetsp:Transcript_158241/g.288495  ORF Transcript_158241/g.288495 Transcript_158241/m.288495 type:complete len:307 (-) Transcript_158241:1877-2797(-)